MKDFLKKHWITSLGVFFVFLSFLYFLKMAFDQGWVPPAGRAAIGLVLGVTGLFTGYTLYKKKGGSLSAEIVAGVGTSIMYATFAYASFSEHILWSTNALLISMVALSSIVMVTGYKLNMRILVFLSLFGGLLTPVVIKAGVEQDMVLFLYVLVLNIAALYLSAVKGWNELRVMSFLSTVAIYITYYVYFDPESWGRPFFYSSALFIVYMVGLILASWYEKDKFEGLNLYLGLINAVHFVFWSIFIFDSFTLPYAFPTLLVGMLFLGAGTLIYRLSSSSLLPVGVYYLLGIVVIAISAGDLGSLTTTPGMHHVINTSVWLMLTGFVFTLGHWVKSNIPKFVAMGIWSLVLIYWYAVAWDVEWIEWFGVKYIPFINPGALVWIGMATLGFLFARHISYIEHPKDNNLGNRLSTILAMASHAVVGGLITIQIQNGWDAYHIPIKEGMVLSIAWVIYALLIFTWGAYTRNIAFRIMGSIVLLVTALKVFFVDLSGEANMYKVALLLLVGLVILLISYINKKWADKEAKEAPQKSIGNAVKQK